MGHFRLRQLSARMATWRHQSSPTAVRALPAGVVAGMLLFLLMVVVVKIRMNAVEVMTY
jgi:hypothetical protein